MNIPGTLYSPSHEHDACGVGFIADIGNIPSRRVVESSIQALVNLEHRGASGGDAETGDGAGVLVQIPHEFFLENGPDGGDALPAFEQYGVGMVFLPRDKKVREACVSAIERVEADYARQCQAARALAETHFDARKVLASLIDRALS